MGLLFWGSSDRLEQLSEFRHESLLCPLRVPNHTLAFDRWELSLGSPYLDGFLVEIYNPIEWYAGLLVEATLGESILSCGAGAEDLHDEKERLHFASIAGSRFIEACHKHVWLNQRIAGPHEMSAGDMTTSPNAHLSTWSANARANRRRIR